MLQENVFLRLVRVAVIFTTALMTMWKPGLKIKKNDDMNREADCTFVFTAVDWLMDAQTTTHGHTH